MGLRKLQNEDQGKGRNLGRSGRSGELQWLSGVAQRLREREPKREVQVVLPLVQLFNPSLMYPMYTPTKLLTVPRPFWSTGTSKYWKGTAVLKVHTNYDWILRTSQIAVYFRRGSGNFR